MTLAETPPSSVDTPRAESGSNGAAEPRSWARSAEDFVRSPSAAIGRPGGKKAKLFADRVRAKPAVSPSLSMMLGQNAIGLGVWGLFFPHSVNRFLGMNADPNRVRLLFGARELVTGGLVADPTRTDLLWARVAGDVGDIAVLRKLDNPANPKRGNARLALGVVLAVTALDLFTAVRMSTVKRNCETTGVRA